jgi:hypothetical protein
MTDPYTPNSRYYGLTVRKRTNAAGMSETFVARRIIPAMARYRALDRHRTDGDERIENLSADYLGDSELYWRICDANGDEDPGLSAQPIGRLITIPLPLEIADDGDA